MLYRTTSQMAYEASREREPSLKAALLELIHVEGGMTCDEIEDLTGECHQTASATISHMNKAKEITDSGQKRKTRRGRKAIVWMIPIVSTYEEKTPNWFDGDDND